MDASPSFWRLHVRSERPTSGGAGRNAAPGSSASLPAAKAMHRSSVARWAKWAATSDFTEKSSPSTVAVSSLASSPPGPDRASPSMADAPFSTAAMATSKARNRLPDWARTLGFAVAAPM